MAVLAVPATKSSELIYESRGGCGPTSISESSASGCDSSGCGGPSVSKSSGHDSTVYKHFRRIQQAPPNSSENTDEGFENVKRTIVDYISQNVGKCLANKECLVTYHYYANNAVQRC